MTLVELRPNAGERSPSGTSPVPSLHSPSPPPSPSPSPMHWTVERGGIEAGGSPVPDSLDAEAFRHDPYAPVLSEFHKCMVECFIEWEDEEGLLDALLVEGDRSADWLAAPQRDIGLTPPPPMAHASGSPFSGQSNDSSVGYLSPSSGKVVRMWENDRYTPPISTTTPTLRRRPPFHITHSPNEGRSAESTPCPSNPPTAPPSPVPTVLHLEGTPSTPSITLHLGTPERRWYPKDGSYPADPHHRYPSLQQEKLAPAKYISEYDDDVRPEDCGQELEEAGSSAEDREALLTPRYLVRLSHQCHCGEYRSYKKYALGQRLIVRLDCGYHIGEVLEVTTLGNKEEAEIRLLNPVIGVASEAALGRAAEMSTLQCQIFDFLLDPPDKLALNLRRIRILGVDVQLDLRKATIFFEPRAMSNNGFLRFPQSTFLYNPVAVELFRTFYLRVWFEDLSPKPDRSKRDLLLHERWPHRYSRSANLQW